jgi:UDPglucose 6-dehydrogenase
VWLQTCWVAWDGKAPGAEDEAAYLEFVARNAHQIKGIHLYGLARPSLQPEAPHLTALAAETGAVHFKNLLNAVLDLNSDRVNRVLEIARGMLPEVRTSKITILGAAFKPNTDDIRHSPALQLAEALADEGAVVTIHDPIALAKVAAAYPQLITEENLDQAFLASDLVILATEWDEYKSLNFAEIKFLVKFPQIVDARNILDVQAWRSVGWNVVQLGEG